MHDVRQLASADAVPPVLEEGAGWLLCCGFGLIFTLLTLYISGLENKLLAGGKKMSSEMFATAGRNLGMGLVASDIVSQWTWAATLLMSSNMAWKVGISGAYWYAAGASVQIMLFAILATQVKRRAPNMRTFIEIIKVRWGPLAHKVFISFALTTNVIVSAMLILGGAATLEALTGMPAHASAFLIPLVASLPYTLSGGLRSTFIAHYFNTLFIFLVLFIFSFTAYANSGGSSYGDTSTVLKGLNAATEFSIFKHVDWTDDVKLNIDDAKAMNMEGLAGFIENAGNCYKIDGMQMLDKACSYSATDTWCENRCEEQLKSNTFQACGHENCISIEAKKHYQSTGCDLESERCVPAFQTMDSIVGLIFGVVNIVGNFGTVFVDQSYWQSAIAVKPESAAKGFILGGLVWFSVPMMMASTMGLVGRALTTDPLVPRGPGYISADDSGSGLTPARVAVVIYDTFGAWMILIMLFMAIVSTGSAEIMAVSTVCTYDVYGEYLHPELKEKRLKRRDLFYSVVSCYFYGPKSNRSEKDQKAIENIDVNINDIPEESRALTDYRADVDDEEGEQGAVEVFTATRTMQDMRNIRESGNSLTFVEMDEMHALNQITFPIKKVPKLVKALNNNGFFDMNKNPDSFDTVRGKQPLLHGSAGFDSLTEETMKKLEQYELGNGVSIENIYYALNSTFHAPCDAESEVLLRVMKFFAIIFAIFMGFVSVFLQVLELNLGFVYMSMGIFVGSAVAPSAMAILYQKASGKWCIRGAVCGLIGGVLVWLAVAQAESGAINLKSLGGDYPFLWSNVTAICLSGFIGVLGSMLEPDEKFRWEYLSLAMPLVDDMPYCPLDESTGSMKKPEEMDRILVGHYQLSCKVAIFLFLFLCLLLPVSLQLSGAVFGPTGFALWIWTFLLWCFFGGLSVIILPLVDFWKDYRNTRKVAHQSAEEVGQKAF